MSCLFCGQAAIIEREKASADEAFLTGFMLAITAPSRVEVVEKSLRTVCEHHGRLIATFMQGLKEHDAETKRSAS